MQFTHGWKWRKVAGADRRVPEAMAGSRQMNLARLRVIRRTAGTDFAFWWSSKEEDKEFDPKWFTLADMAAARMPSQTLTCRMTGADLIEIHEKFISKQQLVVLPAYKPADIDLKRTYSVAMPPWLPGTLTNWMTIHQRIMELDKLEKMRDSGEISRLVKKEGLMIERKIKRLLVHLSGIRHMNGIPNLIFVVDIKREATAVHEANLKKIPILVSA